MSEKIDRLCDQLRIKLHGIDRRLEALKGNNATTSEKSRHLVESQMDGVQQRIHERRHRVEAANASVADWIGKRAAFDGQDASWKDHADLSRLEARAEEVEGYATAVFELAVAAADEAAQAALEALLARNDSEIAAFQHVGQSSLASRVVG
jgi:DNA-binding transcriptional MerR regulator